MFSINRRSFLAIGLATCGSLTSQWVSFGETPKSFPDLPKAITSFGAAVAGDFVYVYGGHTGNAHEYSKETTLKDFLRIRVDGLGDWQTLEPGVRSQGASLVADDSRIYRIGGMTALNEEGESDDLRSLDDVACFDLADESWKSLPPLPKGRSSHDSVRVGNQLFVVGGWELTGQRNSGNWFDHMFVADLGEDTLTWSTIPQPFKRRAIAAVAYQGKIYVIGGMDVHNDTSKAVDIYDVESKKWTKGPDLLNGPMMGFGAAACATDDGIYVTPYSGDVLHLSQDHETWNTTGELGTHRFFHRLVALDSDRLLAIGGASRKEGHMAGLEVIELSPKLE